jgi:hypothetical protein
VHDCLDHYCAVTPYDRVLNTAQHFSTDFDYRQVTDAEMSKALERRAQAGPEERDIYANYIIEQYLQRLEQDHPGFMFQFSLGADPLPYETASRIRQTTLRELGELIARHPKLNFQCHISSLHANQTLCTFCRELPNFSLAAYCADWSYAKATMIRKQLANVLARKIAQGQYDEELALATARQIFYETPQSLCGMKPKVIGAKK